MAFDHDVFISYATVDDRPAKRGWVSAFVSSLNESLAAAFGLRDADRIWWDRSNIDEEASLTDQIRTKVQKSACMIVILSQGYSKSKWCRQEREAFLTAVAGQPEADRRLFLIDIGNLDQKDRPQEFSDKRGRFFYVQPPNTTNITDREPLGFPVPDPENKEHKSFFSQVDQLAKDLHERVSKLRGATTVVPHIKPKSHITLFVAESADDVTEEREEVVRFLSDHFHVLPASDDPIPNRWDQLQATLVECLKASTLFVQILGTLPGRKIAGSDQKLVIAQFEKAKSEGKRIVSWRKVVPELVTDGRLKELVASAEFWGPIAEFNSEIKRIALTPIVKPVERSPVAGFDMPPTVFIHAGIEDVSQAEHLSSILSELNCWVTTPLTTGEPDKIREDLEANLIECDGLIVFYGRISPDWVRAQFRSLPRILPKRQKLEPPRPLKALAICSGEPPDHPNPGVNVPGMQWLDLSQGLSRDRLSQWVALLRNGGAT